jgi:predicted Zn-dependent peptidase
MQLQTSHPQTNQAYVTLPTDYDLLTNSLRIIFRRYAFQPAAICAYLAIIAVDIHRIRSDLMQRLLFQSNEFSGSENLAHGLPL